MERTCQNGSDRKAIRVSKIDRNLAAEKYFLKVLQGI
jgi:hypothetical protein